MNNITLIARPNHAITRTHDEGVKWRYVKTKINEMHFFARNDCIHSQNYNDRTSFHFMREQDGIHSLY